MENKLISRPYRARRRGIIDLVILWPPALLFASNRDAVENQIGDDFMKENLRMKNATVPWCKILVSHKSSTNAGELVLLPIRQNVG